MIHYVFDLDDTLIIHQKGVRIKYNEIKKDETLINLLDNCRAECYIYTNGTFGHAHSVIRKMNIKKFFFKVYSRDTLPYMKPDMRSFIAVKNDINRFYPDGGSVFFFDDLLENLKEAKSQGWITFWINPDFLSSHQYDYVDYAFRNIKEALIYLEKQNNSIF
tara:strand:- start:1407 stop:1892 length:486 start_codon:yes stop_codon:yes gene_type:complete